MHHWNSNCNKGHCNLRRERPKWWLSALRDCLLLAFDIVIQVIKVRNTTKDGFDVTPTFISTRSDKASKVTWREHFIHISPKTFLVIQLEVWMNSGSAAVVTSLSAETEVRTKSSAVAWIPIDMRNIEIRVPQWSQFWKNDSTSWRYRGSRLPKAI